MSKNDKYTLSVFSDNNRWSWMLMDAFDYIIESSDVAFNSQQEAEIDGQQALEQARRQIE